MNIFYDSTIFHMQKYGGVSRYFSEIIRRISKYAHVKINALKALNILPSRLARLSNMFVDFKLAAGKYNIYHPTYYSDNIKKRKDVKTIVTVFDMVHELYLSKFKSLDRGIDIKKKSILDASHIICISNKTKQDLQEIYKIRDESISVVYFGASLDDRNQKKEGFKQPGRPYILYVGKRWGYKNFKILVKAFKLLGLKKDFDLICSGGGWFLKEEVAWFRKMQLEDSIKYVEGPNKFLRLYYKNAAFFVYPSLYEGFGLPLLEAMDNDCAVIAANAGSIPEVTGDAALLFSPTDIDELCHCMKVFLTDSHIKNEYVKKGKDRVKDFSWDKAARETYEVYKKVLIESGIVQ